MTDPAEKKCVESQVGREMAHLDVQTIGLDKVFCELQDRLDLILRAIEPTEPPPAAAEKELPLVGLAGCLRKQNDRLLSLTCAVEAMIRRCEL